MIISCQYLKVSKGWPAFIQAIIFTFCLGLTAIQAQTINPKYDSTLAKKLGADDYGMKRYVFVVLKTGSNKTTDKAFTDSCFAGHLKNIGKLAEERKLIVAGPFGKNDNDFRGLFILNVTTIEAATEMLQSDPAIKEELLLPVMYPWYGSAALPEYLEASDKVWKIDP